MYRERTPWGCATVDGRAKKRDGDAMSTLQSAASTRRPPCQPVLPRLVEERKRAAANESNLREKSYFVWTNVLVAVDKCLSETFLLMRLRGSACHSCDFYCATSHGQNVASENLVIAQIGSACGISQSAVRSHRQRMFARLGMRNDAGLIGLAVELGLRPSDMES